MKNLKKILMFAGTTEGREFSKLLLKNDFDVTISVATEYGKILVLNDDFLEKKIKVLEGRLNQNEIEQLIQKFDLIIDATHPFATEVSKNIVNACKNKNISYFRLLRSQEKTENLTNNDFFSFDSLDLLCDKIVEIEKDSNLGNIFISTGSKEISCFQKIQNYQNRCFIRVLPTVDSIQKCIDAKFSPKNIIAMQGPFSVLMNEAMFKETNSCVLVTKESGKTGGFDEKIIAARNCGMKIFSVKRPKENCENIFENFDELLEIIQRYFR